MSSLSGLIAAVHTPMHVDGRLHLAVVDQLAERAVRDGLSGVFVCGTTGEFPSLTVDERRQLAARWVNAAAGRFPVVVHVGGTCLADSKALAAHAQEIGCDAVSAIGPYFFEVDCVDDLVDYTAEVAAAAPDLPFYYYHLPALSGVNLPMAEYLAAASESLPTLAGVKYSDLDLLDLGRAAVARNGRYTVLFGCDEVLLSGITSGARGAVGSTYGFAAPLYREMLESFDAGDLRQAQALQARAMEMVAVLHRHGGLAATKVAMGLAGVDCGPVRAPLRQLTDVERAALEAELDAVGFRDFRPGTS